MCDCATELERKRREIEERAGLKSRSPSRVSSFSSLACSGGDSGDGGSPGLLAALMMFFRGQITLREVAHAAGISGRLGMVGGLVGGGALLAVLALLTTFRGEGASASWSLNPWKKPVKNCIPRPVPAEAPPRINKRRLKWPEEDDE